MAFMQQNLPEYDSLLQEIELLKSENIRLKDILKANGIAYEPVNVVPAEEMVYSDITFPDAHLGKDDRVALI